MICLRSLTRTSFIAATAISLLAAGCGGGSSPAAGTSSHRSVLAYAQCMHAHGVPGFPDPGPSGAIDKAQITVLGNGPQIQRASTTCEHLMPASGLGPARTGPSPQTRFLDEMAFARCIRSHGLPAFPDPTRPDQLTHAMIAAAGIDVQQPAVARAADACVGVTHGAITRAAVARFIAGQ